MKKLAKGSLICAVVLCVFMAIAWVNMPATVARLLLNLNNLSAGLTAKVVQTEIGDVHYLEGGEGETVLLIHGIFARKEHWVEMVRPLVKKYHIIALDLPGFGDNAGLPDAQYALEQQVANVSTVLDALEIERAHFGANSMGAYVTALLVAERPEIAASVAFIGSPLGVTSPIQSDMDIAISQGHFPLVVQTTDDFLDRNDWLSPQLPYLPGPILRSWMTSEVSTADHNLHVWHMVEDRASLPTVLDLAPALTMPSLIVWCQPDRIFHVSGASVLDHALPSSTRVTPDDCGHLPMLDQPEVVAEHYLTFLGSIDRSSE